jgi:hypothetical protein
MGWFQLSCIFDDGSFKENVQFLLQLSVYYFSLCAFFQHPHACPLCDYLGTKRTIINVFHLAYTHNVDSDEDCLPRDSIESFDSWLSGDRNISVLHGHHCHSIQLAHVGKFHRINPLCRWSAHGGPMWTRNNVDDDSFVVAVVSLGR